MFHYTIHPYDSLRGRHYWYVIGHFDAAREWCVDVISGSEHRSERMAQLKAEAMIEILQIIYARHETRRRVKSVLQAIVRDGVA